MTRAPPVAGAARGSGKPGPQIPLSDCTTTVGRAFQGRMKMTDYRSFVESKLAELDRRRTEIEAERERLTMTLGVMDEADAALGRHATPGTATSPALTPVPVGNRRHSQVFRADDSR